MRPPETPNRLKGQSKKATVRERQELLQSSSISAATAGSTEPAGSAAEGSPGLNPSTVAKGKTPPTTATAHPSQSAPTGGLESGNDPDQLMRQEQAALMLEVTPRCLENWRHRGGGPNYVRISARCIRYRRSDLHEWVEARLRTSTSDCGTDAA